MLKCQSRITNLIGSNVTYDLQHPIKVLLCNFFMRFEPVFSAVESARSACGVLAVEQQRGQKQILRHKGGEMKHST